MQRMLRIGLCALVAASSTLPVAAQETLERTPNLTGGWIGQAGMLHLDLPFRFLSVDGPDGRSLAVRPALDLQLGLPRNLLAGFRFAPESPVVAGAPTEWEASARYRPFEQVRGHGVDLAATAAWNGAAGSLDAELSLARWAGPLRVIGAVRGFSDGYGGGEARLAVAGGAVWHPLPGRAPVAVVGDIGMPSDRRPGEEIAWSAGVQLGASFTTHTFSLFATNSASPTLQGSSRGDGTVRIGAEMTVPIPLARFVGWVVPREQAVESVVASPERVGEVVRVDMARYLFLAKRVEIDAGTTVEWRNLDDMMHTVNSEDGAWRSGPIESGESWRARFDRPGRYLYYCGPHPFMKGEILVR
jgi:plastocyanin